MGELKVNGFSSYIHPLGDDHLMTIGQDADTRVASRVCTSRSSTSRT